MGVKHPKKYLLVPSPLRALVSVPPYSWSRIAMKRSEVRAKKRMRDICNRIGRVSWLADLEMRHLYRYFDWPGLCWVASRGRLLPVFTLFYSISLFNPLRSLPPLTDATHFVCGEPSSVASVFSLSRHQTPPTRSRTTPLGTFLQVQ